MKLFSVSRNISLRGSGLGNELIPAAKSYLCAQATGSSLIPHSWGLNRRGYRHLFGTSLLDFIEPMLALAVSANTEITREMWINQRVENYGTLCNKIITQQPLSWATPVSTIVHSGMWGGYALIDPARDWVRETLVSSNGTEVQIKQFQTATIGASYKIGLHIRRGDFSLIKGNVQGQYNFAIPIDWYRAVLERILPLLPADTIVCAFSDSPSTPIELIPSGKARFKIWQPPFPSNDIADLINLASCDLIVCSVSSYSTMAAWLGRKPYIWLKDQLHEYNGRFSIWGNEATDGNWLQSDALTSSFENLRSPCIPALFNGFLDLRHFESILDMGYSQHRHHDPIRYGCTW